MSFYSVNNRVWAMLFIYLNNFFYWSIFVLISGIHQNDSVVHICVSILFQILFPFRLLETIE